jgi:hypothetical protein
MNVLLIFLQIVLFPFSVFIISFLVNKFIAKPDNKLYKLTSATNFAVSGYILGGFLLFPLYFLFRPVKIDGVTYLLGNNLIAYWIISFVIITPLVIGFCAYLFYFKKVKSDNIIKDAIIIGLYQVPLGWIFEIVIYVYWRKTIPTIYDYFFGKNFPWIMINWIIGAIIPLIIALIIKHKKLRKKNEKEGVQHITNG